MRERGSSRLRANTKVAFETGWIDKPPMPLAEAAEYYEREGVLGIEPWSMRCAVLDVDGGPKADGSKPSPDELARLSDEIVEWIGARPFGKFHSASGKSTGKHHLWFLFDETATAPLGYRALNIGNIPRKCSSGLKWAGPGTSFDTRCINSYVRFDSYIEGLAEALKAATGRPRGNLSKLAEIDAYCRKTGGPKLAPRRTAKASRPAPKKKAETPAKTTGKKPASVIPFELPKREVWNANLCDVKGCNNLAASGEYCTAHYDQVRRGEEPKPLEGPKAQQRLCAFPGCARVHKARGYCEVHYRQLQRGETLYLPHQREQRTCEFPGCSNPHLAKGYCRAHYRQTRSGAILRPLGQQAHRSCDFDGCSNPHRAKGYCKAHYRQLQRGEKLRPLGTKVREKRGCEFPCCGKPQIAKGYCTAHYQQLQRGEKLRPLDAKSKARALPRSAIRQADPRDRRADIRADRPTARRSPRDRHQRGADRFLAGRGQATADGRELTGLL